MQRDYSVFERTRVPTTEISRLSFDIFISSFNDSERVLTVFNEVQAPLKFWVVHEEYGYAASERPQACWTTQPAEPELDAWNRFFSDNSIERSQSLGIDITGMMRPHLIVLPLVLQQLGFLHVTFLYSDPISYRSGQDTAFTKGPVDRVDVVAGFAGSRVTSMTAHDCLVIGAGYDHELVKAVAESKQGAEHFILVGMPGLQTHMYQESVYRIAQAKESINGFRSRSLLHAPANNPFMTAQVLSDHISAIRSKGEADNVYLSPVGPKSQVLGFAWFYLSECVGSSTSIVFPYSLRYSRETSSGIGAVHTYSLELDSLMDPT